MNNIYIQLQRCAYKLTFHSSIVQIEHQFVICIMHLCASDLCFISCTYHKRNIWI